MQKAKRFTLSIPEGVHSELTRMADKNGISSKEVIIKSLKLALIAFETEQDRNKELIIRETKGDTVTETKLVLI